MPPPWSISWRVSLLCRRLLGSQPRREAGPTGWSPDLCPGRQKREEERPCRPARCHCAPAGPREAPASAALPPATAHLSLSEPRSGLATGA